MIDGTAGLTLILAFDGDMRLVAESNLDDQIATSNVITYYL